MLTRQDEWQSAHECLSRIAKDRARTDCEEGKALIRAFRTHVHLHLGYGSFAEYIARVLGYRPRWTEERLRVAEALEGLPALQRALSEGEISWSAARELTRVATTEIEVAWLETARGQTLRQIEQLVLGHQRGDQPDDSRDPSVARHVLRVEVSAETMATFREAMSQLRRTSGTAVDEDSVLLLMARCVLAGPKDEGRSSYQVAVTVCKECHRGFQHGKGEAIEVGSDIAAMANCDAQHLGLIGEDLSTGESARLHDCAHVGEGGRPNGARLHDGAHVGDGLDTESANDAGLGHANSEEATRKPSRAHQDVPPAVRREVLRRDGGCCVVPGCRNATFLDIHHVIRRADGGTHHPDTLITLCSAHHRAQHRGRLAIEGRVSTGLVFRHADGAMYGRTVDPVAAGTYAHAFDALRTLGFREREVQKALTFLQRKAPSSGAAPTFPAVMRNALARLTDARNSHQIRSTLHG